MTRPTDSEQCFGFAQHAALPLPPIGQSVRLAPPRRANIRRPARYEGTSWRKR